MSTLPRSTFRKSSIRIATFLLLAILAAGFATLSYAAAPDRIQGSLTSGKIIVLEGNVRHEALPQFDEGVVDPAMRLGTITLLTAPTGAQQNALTQLLAQQQDRNSPNFHKWLTPDSMPTASA